MTKTKEALPKLKCLRCGHKWVPRSDERPGQCPRKTCRSSIWDRPVKKARK